MADGSNANATNQGSTFPTFLEHDPYPTSNDGRPTTSDSNATSEFEARSGRASTVPSTTGPVGEPGLPPSRPSSNATNDQFSNPRSSVRQSTGPPPSSRRGIAPYSRDGSRPGSALGQTHVPSLTNPGFFRPMSPQMLQAQRGSTAYGSPPSSRGATPMLPSSRGTTPLPLQQHPQPRVVEERDGDEEHRYSIASVNTERDAKMSMSRDGEIPPLPVSRGFSINSDSGDGYGFQSTVGPGSVVSKGSIAPLNTKHMRGQDSRGTLGGSTAPPLSPTSRSLRASLGLGSKHGSIHSSLRNMHDRKPSKSHEKLHSNPQSPVPQNEKAEAAPAPQKSGKPTGKNYEYYGGNMLFFLSGRFLNTRAKPLNVVTFILTVLPGALFFGFSAPWLWHHISPAIPIVIAYFYYLSISAFLHAAFSDPGILPRNLHPHPPNPDEDRDPLTVGPATTEWVMVKTFPSGRAQASPQSSAENGQGQGAMTAMEVPTKYCKSCNIWRPPRAHHCRVCDGCIETQDHHCVWLNNCVGRRNYRYFFAYVGFATVFALLIMSCSLVHIAYYGRQNALTFGQSLSGRTQERVTFAMFIYSVFALPYPGCLFGYHLFLVGRGETTREYLNSHKFLPKNRHRPFSQQSLFKNWISVLGRPRGPSYMGFKRKYQQGDNRLGHTRRREDRIQDAKLETARRGERVEGLKKRYSVPTNDKPRNNGATGNKKAVDATAQNGGEVEMKQLPPIPKSKNALGDDLTGITLGNGNASQ